MTARCFSKDALDASFGMGIMEHDKYSMRHPKVRGERERRIERGEGEGDKGCGSRVYLTTTPLPYQPPAKPVVVVVSVT